MLDILKGEGNTVFVLPGFGNLHLVKTDHKFFYAPKYKTVPRLHKKCLSISLFI